MGLFTKNEAEVARKRNLQELEDKRVRFAQLLEREGFRPENCLYVQKEGGFAAVARRGDELFLLTGPAPGAPEDFTFRRVKRARAHAEDILVKSEGLGGILGFGKKGGVGFRLVITPESGEALEMELISGLGTFLEIKPGARTKNALLSSKRRRGNANFVWDFMPLDRDMIEPLRTRWLAIINNEEQ